MLKPKRPYLLAPGKPLNVLPRHINKEGKRRAAWKRFSEKAR